MNDPALLDELRKKIGQAERADERSWPVVGSGAADFDASLPEGGFATGALHEVLPATYADFPAALGFGLGMAARILDTRPGPMLWVLPAYQTASHGALHPDGLAAFGIDPDRLIHVSAPKTQTMLWALEEALANRAVSVVTGILPENDRFYDFTPSRRLVLGAARHGVTALVFATHPQAGGATAAMTRWSVAAEPGIAAPRAGQAVPGLTAPRWHVHLLRSRRGGRGQWHLEWNHETLSFRLAAPLADRTPQRSFGLHTGQRAAG
ncbi:inducible mutagenesis protein A [Oricola sp.]|uniref:ImuA family protein n=1 Tax=Oricola sp. TaxID=1979950 RepID=UPI0025FC9FBD|nr:inducible mutagenesis protein A [Oricola sp.]MCI5076646.1 inducible mutagenesis protein A [Oricola sp.]